MRVDTRAGSEKLIAPLRAIGVDVEEAILPAGDVEIIGNGPEGRPVLVGVEHKSWEDVTQCLRNGRFAEQVRGMRDYYEVKWLLIEGRIKSEDGLLSVQRGVRWFKLPGQIRYQEFAAWMATMCQSAGVLVWRTETKEESVAWLKALNRWWTEREWEDHRSHMEFYTPPVGGPFIEPSLTVRVASALPGIGSVKAERVAVHFGSVKKMVLASEKDWAYIEGLGKKSAAKIVAAIEEGA